MVSLAPAHLVGQAPHEILGLDDLFERNVFVGLVGDGDVAGAWDERWMRRGPFTATVLSAMLFSYGSADGLDHMRKQ